MCTAATVWRPVTRDTITPARSTMLSTRPRPTPSSGSVLSGSRAASTSQELFKRPVRVGFSSDKSPTWTQIKFIHSVKKWQISMVLMILMTWQTNIIKTDCDDVQSWYSAGVPRQCTSTTTAVTPTSRPWTSSTSEGPWSRWTWRSTSASAAVRIVTRFCRQPGGRRSALHHPYFSSLLSTISTDLSDFWITKYFYNQQIKSTK